MTCNMHISLVDRDNNLIFLLSISLNKETVSVLTKHASKCQLMETSRQQLICSYVFL